MASNFYKAGAAAMTSNKDDWETVVDDFVLGSVKP